MTLTRFDCYGPSTDDGSLRDVRIGDCYLDVNAITAIGPIIRWASETPIRTVTVQGGASYMIPNTQLQIHCLVAL